MKQALSILATVMFLHLLPGTGLAQGHVIPEEYQLDLHRARVLRIIDTVVSVFPDGRSTRTQVAQIQILNKAHQGTIAEVRSTLSGNPAYDIELKKGSLVSVHAERRAGGEILFYVMGYERTHYMLHLMGIFLVCLVAIGGKKGAKAIVALAVTIFLVLYILVPLLLRGYSPVLVSIGVCALSTLVTLSVIAGWNRKSIAAIIGTVAGITMGGILAYAYGLVARLTGFSSTEAQMLMYIPDRVQFDYRGLLFAGILIGALGAAMDVSMSIASALTELAQKEPHLPFHQLVRHGMNIGRDIMGTMANTLILAYTGGALSMVLVFTAFNKTFSEIVNLDSVATEIVRAMAGSVGLLFAVPFTALAYVFLADRSYGACLFKAWRRNG